jgi:tetratricopeptide (TPR) repeat protein
MKSTQSSRPITPNSVALTASPASTSNLPKSPKQPNLSLNTNIAANVANNALRANKSLGMEKKLTKAQRLALQAEEARVAEAQLLADCSAVLNSVINEVEAQELAAEAEKNKKPPPPPPLNLGDIVGINLDSYSLQPQPHDSAVFTPFSLKIQQILAHFHAENREISKETSTAMLEEFQGELAPLISTIKAQFLRGIPPETLPSKAAQLLSILSHIIKAKINENQGNLALHAAISPLSQELELLRCRALNSELVCDYNLADFHHKTRVIYAEERWNSGELAAEDRNLAWIEFSVYNMRQKKLDLAESALENRVLALEPHNGPALLLSLSLFMVENQWEQADIVAKKLESQLNSPNSAYSNEILPFALLSVYYELVEDDLSAKNYRELAEKIFFALNSSPNTAQYDSKLVDLLCGKQGNRRSLQLIQSQSLSLYLSRFFSALGLNFLTFYTLSQQIRPELTPNPAQTLEFSQFGPLLELSLHYSRQSGQNGLALQCFERVSGFFHLYLQQKTGENGENEQKSAKNRIILHCYGVLGEIQWNLGRFNAALEYFSQFMAFHANSGLICPLDSSILHKITKLLVVKHQNKQAIALITRFLTFSPQNTANSTDSSEKLAIYHWKTHKTLGYSADSKNSYLWCALAESLLQSGQFPGAETALNKALQLDPHNHRAFCLVIINNLRNFKQKHDQNEGNSNGHLLAEAASLWRASSAKLELADFALVQEIGILFYQVNEIELARKALETALKLRPNSATVAQKLKWLDIKQGMSSSPVSAVDSTEIETENVAASKIQALFRGKHTRKKLSQEYSRERSRKNSTAGDEAEEQQLGKSGGTTEREREISVAEAREEFFLKAHSVLI